MATLVRSDRYYSLRRCLFIDCPHHRSSIIPAHIPSLSFSPSFVSTLIFNCVVFDFQDFAWKSSFCHSLCVRPSSDRGPATMRPGLRCDEMWPPPLSWGGGGGHLQTRGRLRAAKLWEEGGIVTMARSGYFVQSDQCSTFAVYVAHEVRVDMFSLSCCYRQ